ncbi:uncharacterized protein sunn [Drosophila tropicalis]|uniref:uncharacterized protein sunn n=1 Tax=Drosophila tropicalis TaxID=46794 RepID=UPI0035AC154B
MDFVTAISTGADTKYIVEEYSYAFLKAVTGSPKFWRAKIAHQFVGQIFQAVGLNFNVSVADFYRSQAHPYRNDNANYVFQPVASVLAGLDEFLEQLPSLLAIYDRQLAVTLSVPESASSKRFDELTRPFPCYLQVVFIWTHMVHSICGAIDLQKGVTVDRFLWEPMARISFSILCGLVKELHRRGEDTPGLKDLCLTLIIYVRYGILFEATSRVILMPMLDIFRDHFTTFLGEEMPALTFIYYTFCVQMPNKEEYYVACYRFLEDRINEFARNQQCDQNGNLYLRFMINELITDKYLVIQFETLQKSTSKPLLLATLRYLMTLQCHVASLELIPQRLVQELLCLILRLPVSFHALSTLAAELYVKMAQRLFYERDIVVHILETFAKVARHKTYQSFRSELTRFLSFLIPHFASLKRFEFYMHILRMPSQAVPLELSLLAAQSILVLLEMHRGQYATSEMAIEEIYALLSNWPHLLESQQPQTRAVLYSVYKGIDFCSVACHNDELLCTLENFVLDKFLNDNTLTDIEFYGLYESLSRSAQATGNSQLHKIAERELMVECGMLQLHLDRGHILPRIYTLLRNNKLSVSLVNNIFGTLAVELMDKPKPVESLAHYGPECLAYMLILLLNNPMSQATEESVFRLVLKLSDFCITELSVTSDVKKIKGLFCAFHLLHLELVNVGLPLPAATYETLLEQLSKASVIKQVPSETLIYIYYRQMHRLFRELHACKEVILPNQRIWKVLMRYKMAPPLTDLVSPELEKLIGTLISHRVDVYTHSFAIILLHICDDTPAKKFILAAINAHLHQIEIGASAFDAWHIRFYTFLISLQLLYKNLTIQRPDAGYPCQRSRLMPLQYIMQLVQPLRIEEFHFKEMSRWIYNMKLQALLPSEKQQIDSFLEELSTYKYACEDEINALQSDQNFIGKLMPLPAGSLDLWQIHLLNSEAQN